jgi:putative colanic acid biosynthesis acetyltransferase WcaF
MPPPSGHFAQHDQMNDDLESVSDPAALDASELARRWATTNAAFVSWPYSRNEYALRLLWIVIYRLIWPFCWERLPGLRTGLLRLLGARAAGNATISGNARIVRPWDMQLGHHVLIGDRATIYNLDGLEIGNHTFLSQDVYLCGGTHDTTDPAYQLLRKKIVIGSYVWIAAGAFIGPGVRIGDGAIVGARAVVVKDVAPWTIVAGNPARVIKKRVVRLKKK